MELQPVQLYYEEFGKGTPVVFLHGYPFDHTIWNPLVPRLETIARLILPDLRGFGQSPVTDGAYTMRLMAEDVFALLETLKIEKAIVVGHSMGGYIAMNFAHAYPNRLAGLGLISTQAAVDTPEQRQNRYNTIETVTKKGIKSVADAMLPKLVAKSEYNEQVHAVMMRANVKGVVGALKGLAERPDATEWLSGIQVPAVVVLGRKDVIVPAERAHTMTRLLPWSWLVEVPEVGHMPMVEASDAVAEAVQQLVRTVEANKH
jgi:3-oxoadipate enol-lactonase